jgi:hypothetical protein
MVQRMRPDVAMRDEAATRRGETAVGEDHERKA